MVKAILSKNGSYLINTIPRKEAKKK